MIHPTEKEIGRKVLYTGNVMWGNPKEPGVITSVSEHFVFVRYGDNVHGQATKRVDLEWEFPE